MKQQWMEAGRDVGARLVLAAVLAVAAIGSAVLSSSKRMSAPASRDERAGVIPVNPPRLLIGAWIFACAALGIGQRLEAAARGDVVPPHWSVAAEAVRPA